MREPQFEGLRGYAALAVVLSHCAYAFWPALHGAGYGAKTPLWQKIIFNSPLGLLYNGTVAVCLFFVLSGYVLSVAFLKTGNDNIIRSMFVRRYIRLTIPITASCILFYLFWEIGLFDADIQRASSWLKHFPKEDQELTFIGALYEGFVGSVLFGKKDYNYVLWTMRPEFYGSLLVFATCLLTKGLRGRHIIYAIAAPTIVYINGAFGFYYLCFLLGIWIADSPRVELGKVSTFSLLAVAFVLGAYHDVSPVYAPLKDLISPIFGKGARLLPYTASGAILVYVTANSQIMRNWMSKPISVWLGSLSFSLYLTHAAVLRSAGVWSFNSTYDFSSYNIAAVIASLVTVALSLSLAVAFRPVDEFAKATAKSVGDALERGRADRRTATTDGVTAPGSQ